MVKRRKTDAGVQRLRKAARAVSRPTSLELVNMPLADAFKKVRDEVEDLLERIVTEDEPGADRDRRIAKLREILAELDKSERQFGLLQVKADG